MEEIKQLTGIYHEHQQGSLCAQHALNNLLQSEVFSADALADIARELDVEEISVLEQKSDESENMDDTGFFNIQVLQRALTIFEIELVPYGSQDPIAKQARTNPETIPAYICNLGLHWYTIRRFGRQYFDLNSFLYVPHLIPNPTLTPFFQLIQNEGYSIFIVHGDLPPCIADEQLKMNPVDLWHYKSLTEKLPKYIMDEKLMGNHNEPVVKVPREVMEEYRKNPNDPHILKKIQSYMPKDVIAGGIATIVSSSPHHNMMSTDLSEHMMDEKLIGNSNTPRLIGLNLTKELMEEYKKNPNDPRFTATVGCPPQTHYHLADKDLSGQMMDENFKNDSKNSHNQRVICVTLPAELKDEYEKNPNDPKIQRKIQSYLPKDLVEKGYTLSSGVPSHSHYPTIDTDLSGHITDEEFMGDCGCPHHHHHHHDHTMTKDLSKQKIDEQAAKNQTHSHPHHHPLTERSPEYFIDESYNDNPNIPQRSQHIVAEYTTQYIVTEPNSDNPNAPPKQRLVTTRETVVMSGPQGKDSLQAMKKAVEEKRARRTEFEMELDRTEEEQFQHALALSLVDTQQTNENVIGPTPEDPTEKMNQFLFDEAIAASLTSTDFVNTQAEETSKSIPTTTVISPPTPLVNTEPVMITNPPLPKITNPSLPMTTVISPPTPTVNTEPVMITNPPSPKITNSSLSMRTPSPPPTVPDSPTIDELRQRRLQFYNNRDRSIIARPSPTSNE